VLAVEGEPLGLGQVEEQSLAVELDGDEVVVEGDRGEVVGLGPGRRFALPTGYSSSLDDPRTSVSKDRRTVEQRR